MSARQIDFFGRRGSHILCDTAAPSFFILIFDNRVILVYYFSEGFLFLPQRKDGKMPKQFFKKALKEARKAANQIKDDHLKAEVLAILVVVSEDKNDLADLVTIIQKIELGQLRSEALTATAKKLAKSGQFVLARRLVHTVKGADNYWKAEALAKIARYSRDAEDFKKAREYAQKINDENLKRELLLDIDLVQKEPQSLLVQDDERSCEKALFDLAEGLIELCDFNKVHSVALKVSSAYLRAKIFLNMAAVLAEANR